MACFNFGEANDFNIFLFGNQTQSNVDSEGRVAVGGNASYNNYGIGNTLPVSLTRADLIVGGNMNIIGGTNFSGNSVISPTGTVIQYTMTNNNGVPGQPLVGSPINFAGDQIYLTCASLAWAALTPTGTVSVNFGQLVLTGFDPVLNIFNFDAENIAGTGFTLETLNGINIVAPLGSTILINITGNNTGFGSYQIFRNGMSATGADGQFIVWNFPQALNLFNMNISIKGSILAPLAQWWAVGFGNVEGTFIANNLINTMGTLEAHNFPFLGCLPDVCSATSSSTTSTTSTTTTTTSTSTSTTSTSTSTTSTSTST
ncbi:choice-of-anchor A domain-containing protein, partial [Paenibacillus sp. 1_12]|uniref:choice-of-anchor A family protein n=1 Tax=Paenibacillus sp. 1_12 TaxID=1566278 RepID=UPI0008F3A30F